MVVVHPFPLARYPPERRGSVKDTVRVSYHLFSNAVLDNLPEQGYPTLKKENSV